MLVFQRWSIYKFGSKFYNLFSRQGKIVHLLPPLTLWSSKSRWVFFAPKMNFWWSNIYDWREKKFPKNSQVTPKSTYCQLQCHALFSALQRIPKGVKNIIWKFGTTLFVISVGQLWIQIQTFKFCETSLSVCDCVENWGVPH